jgi:serine protease
MSGFRARALCATVALAGGLVMSLRGQTADESRMVIQEHLGLAAIDEGLIQDDSHTPSSLETRRRAALREALLQDRVGASGGHYRPGRVIVKFRDEAAMPERRAAVRAASDTGEIADRPTYADFDIVRIDPAEDAEEAASVLRQRPEVQYAQTAHRVHALFVPNDPLYATLQWNLPLINMEKAWDIQPQAGSSITVAVIDTGMAYQNATITATLPAFRDDQGNQYPALGNVTIPYSAAPQLVGAGHDGRIVAPHDFVNETGTPLDFDGHGTHVSGTIGQLTNDNIGTAGVAFNVKLMPVKVLASAWDLLFAGLTNISNTGGSDDDVARGIRYAADNGAKVINMSLGSSGPPNCATNPNQSDCSPVIEAAMRYAVGKGCFIVVSAGNEFEDTVPPYGTNPTSVFAEIASRIPGVVSVAAVDRAKAHAYYSSAGSYVELAAPGGSERGFGSDGYVRQQTFDFTFTDTFLLSPAQYHAPRFDVFGYIGYIGTSMAAPHVAGVAAMLMQQGVTDPAVIEEILEKTAVDLGKPGRDDTFGFGLVDARAALRGLGLAK